MIAEINSQEKSGNSCFTSFKINLKFLFFFLYLFIFAQFFACFFSILNLSLSILTFGSFCFALAVSLFISKDQNFYIYLSKFKIVLIFSFAILATFLFCLRLNYGIFDLFCPTYLLQMVTQVSRGNFPVSFMSYPNFAANYHQGFIYLSGVVSYFMGISPFWAIKGTLVFLFFVIMILLQLLALKFNNKYFFLPVLLTIFSTSATLTWYKVEMNWWVYLSVFEYIGSNSWPLSIIVLLLLVFYLDNNFDTLNFRKISVIMALMLATSTINATVFSVLLISFIGCVFINILSDIKAKIFKNNLLIYAYIIFLILILYFIPRFFVSAFLVGQHYDSTHLALRILDGDYFNQIKGYIKLTGPIILAGLVGSFFSVKKLKEKPVIKLLVIFLLSSFVFPIIFKFNNIEYWDNFHKFIIINIFISIIIITMLLPILDSSKNHFIWFLVIISMLCGIPAVYNLFVYRTSFNFFNYSTPANNIKDVVHFLNTQSGKIEIYSFGKNNCFIDDSFTTVGSYAGSSVINDQQAGFLLSIAEKKTQ